MSTQVDVLIVGAGLSGIGAAYRLQTGRPGTTYAIVEARDVSGGTWDLFRYPGIRSDSDMFTLSYPFRPWREAKAIADGGSILRYLRETAADFGIDRRIRYRHRVTGASWSSQQATWTVHVDADGVPSQFTCRFLYLCTGYYRYDAGYAPPLPGQDRFAGPVIHPQHWPDDLDYAGKQVVVIGSGATAVTLVPALAERAERVTMLQRSPSYVLSRSDRDPIADLARSVLPEKLAHRLSREKNAVLTLALYTFCRRYPDAARRMLQAGVARELPSDIRVDPHFVPSYAPWDQRICVAPNADLFAAMRAGRAAVATGQIETLTENGIRLTSGEELPADLVVTATGLSMLLAGGARLEVDGVEVNPADTVVYKGVLLSDVPNLALCVGYTNASWTLRADLSSRYVCRLLRQLDRRGADWVVAHAPDTVEARRPLLDLSSGYIRRATGQFPRQGTKAPWHLSQNYLLDLISMRFGSVSTSSLRFGRSAGMPAESGAAPVGGDGLAR